MKTFDDWFLELEGHCLRAERFYNDVATHTDATKLAECMRKWLCVAYDMGREHMKEDAVQTAQQFARKMDAGKEHIVVALENLK